MQDCLCFFDFDSMTEYDNRKDAWEGNAQETLNNFLRMTEDELITLVNS